MKGLFLPPGRSSLGGVWDGLPVAMQNLFPPTASLALAASLPGEEEVDRTRLLVSEVGEVGIEGNTLGGVGCRPNLLGRGGGRVRPSPCGSDWLFLMLARFISQLAIHSQSSYHR